MDDLSRKEIKRQLQQMDPYEFEKLVAELWELEGYETTVRKGSGDRGIDVEATKDTPFEQKVLIQAKRYTEGNKVGSEEVRNYATLYQQVPDTDSVIVVTTSEFTNSSEELAKDINIKTLNGEKLAELISDNTEELDLFNSDVSKSDIENNLENIIRESKLLKIAWENKYGKKYHVRTYYKENEFGNYKGRIFFWPTDEEEAKEVKYKTGVAKNIESQDRDLNDVFITTTNWEDSPVENELKVIVSCIRDVTNAELSDITKMEIKDTLANF